MAVNPLEAPLRVCYCPTRTFAHELLVIWPVACLAWLPCTEHQSCEHSSHEGIPLVPLELLNGSQSPGSNFTRLLLPYKDLHARTFGNLACCLPSLATIHRTLVLWTFESWRNFCRSIRVIKWQSIPWKPLYASVIVLQGPFGHDFLVIWPVACLAWLPCTEDQSCEHLSHEGISVGPLG